MDIHALRNLEAPAIVCVGSHPGIIQSILDFDYVQGRDKPSVRAIIAAGRRNERYFYGEREVLIPVYESHQAMRPADIEAINLCLNLVSGRRVLATTREIIENFPRLIGAVVFAERVPERHALELGEIVRAHDCWLLGGSSVGLLIPGALKLGAIGGIQAAQLEQAKAFQKGQVAVVSSSGGMVNEIIRVVAASGYGVSFAAAIGGERFPVASPRDVLLAAERDEATKAVAYFGELGGQDEYEIAELLTSGQLTKPFIAYIAGTVSDLFETPPQFGHAKAMAAHHDESAAAKRGALRQAGGQAADSFKDFITAINQLSLEKLPEFESERSVPAVRKHSLITSTVSYDQDSEVKLLGTELLSYVENRSLAAIVISMLLGKDVKSKDTEEFVDFVLRLLVDHGPYVSGAVNTIVTARAGRDLVSSLAAGLLTIGPRFGGAINQAAATWLEAVSTGVSASQLVENFAAERRYLSGIGHKKYRIDLPDPRVKKLLTFTERLENSQFTNFALAVEANTVRKKGNLILNVDGAIAAILLDMLHEKEGYSVSDLERLTRDEFFNSLFVLSRSVGFMAHYFDQKRLDEGLFRLEEQDVLHPDIG